MRFQSVINDDESSRRAADDVIGRVRDGGLKVDAAFVFFTAAHREEAAAMLERFWLQLDPQAVIGCSAEGVIGGEEEIERRPGLVVLVAEMPAVRLHPFHVGVEEWREMIGDADALRERAGYGPETRAVVGLGDPFTTPLNPLLTAMDAACPLAPLVGGMASSAREPGQNVLFHNDAVHADGLVGMSISGPADVKTVVSQGCRPIGQTFVITKAHENVIEQLGGRPAMTAIRDMLPSIPPEDRGLLAGGLLIGRALSEYRETFGRGDFLVRGLVGGDEKSGAIAVADEVRVGQTVQFHVRDAATAGEDLTLLLEGEKAEAPPAGGLLFSCNGRGTRMFPSPGHDIGVARRLLPATPVAGFFAAGELGPVGGRNFVHGHTASFALFRDRK